MSERKFIFSLIDTLSCPREKLSLLLEEYEVSKRNFTCSQCGSNLKFEMIYFVSAYIKCEFCKTQNTFIPSTKMSMLPNLVKEIANKSTGKLEYPIIGDNFFEKFIRVEDRSRKQYFIKKELIPDLTKSYLNIYLREINDYMLNNDYNQDNYMQIIQYYRNQYTDILVEEYSNIIENNNIDEKLIALTKIKNHIELNKELLNSNILKEPDLKSNTFEKLENLESKIDLNISDLSKLIKN